jgi:RNA polymerase sigma factor (sigma-70 family)
LERILAGDEAAMAPLIEAGWPRFGGRARRSVDRDELRQEAISTLLEVARGAGETPEADFVAQAIVRMRRRLATVVRAEGTRRQRSRPLVESDAARAAYQMETRFAQQVESPDLARALRRLPPRQRAIIARIYWEGRSAAEIAAGDGVQTDTIRQLRRQAERTLRRALAGRSRPG